MLQRSQVTVLKSLVRLVTSRRTRLHRFVGRTSVPLSSKSSMYDRTAVWELPFYSVSNILKIHHRRCGRQYWFLVIYHQKTAIPRNIQLSDSKHFSNSAVPLLYRGPAAHLIEGPVTGLVANDIGLLHISVFAVNLDLDYGFIAWPRPWYLACF